MAFNYGVSGDIRDDVKRNATATELPGGEITRGQKWATAFLDGYLEPLYPDSVPFASGSVPAMVDWAASQLGVYFVLRSLYKMRPPNWADIREEYYDNITKWLEDLREGHINLPELVAQRAPEVESNTKDFTPIFGLDDPEHWKVDADRLEDIQDSRD